MLQESREQLLKAYRDMRTIRVFEDRVHDEFAAGSIPGGSVVFGRKVRSAAEPALAAADEAPARAGTTPRGLSARYGV